jgi:hypothetical protein
MVYPSVPVLKEPVLTTTSLSSSRHAIPVPIPLPPAVHQVLATEARELGFDLADHLTSILVSHILPRLQAEAPDVAKRLEAEARVKDRVRQISRDIAQREGVQPDHTLRVFRELRQSAALAGDYICATGCETGFEGGNPLKHGLNLVLGAISKRAARAKVRKRGNGLPEKIRNIRGEFCGSVTVLEPNAEDDCSRGR